MTPEGKVKAWVSSVLKAHRPDVYYEMPVPGGFGKSGLDYIGWCRGKPFAIETKRPGGKPTSRQLMTMNDMRFAGGTVFLIDSRTCEDAIKLLLFLEGR